MAKSDVTSQAGPPGYFYYIKPPGVLADLPRSAKTGQCFSRLGSRPPNYNGSMVASDSTNVEFRLAPEPLRYRIWPLVNDLPAVAPLLAGAAALCWLVAAQTDGRYAVAVALVQLVLLWRLLVPTTYEMNAAGVAVRRWRRVVVPWNRVAKAEVGRRGVLLLPVRSDSSIVRLRGIYVPWGPHEEAVRGMLSYYLAPRGKEAESSRGQGSGKSSRPSASAGSSRQGT